MSRNTIHSLLHSVFVTIAKTIRFALIENHLLHTSEYRIYSEKLPPAFNGYRIVQLSDLHSACFGRENTRLIHKIEAAKPDLIVMTGDMVSRWDSTHNVFFHLAKTLGSRYLCYYVIGNHEQDMNREQLQKFYSRLTACGVHVLDNETLELKRAGQSIRLTGMWYPLEFYSESKHTTRHFSFTLEDMKRRIKMPEGQSFEILLTHNPLSFEVYAAAGADLTFCGHVHGGMIRLPFLGGLLSPERQFFPKYSAGVYSRGERKMVVSRGLGSGLFAARIFNIPEVVAVTLSTEKEL